MGQQLSYHKLDNSFPPNDLEHPKYGIEDDRLEDSTKGIKSKPRFRSFIWQWIAIGLLLVASTTILVLHLRLLRKVYPPSINCGWTIEEAIGKGCSYDLLAKAWMPAACPSIGNEEYVNLSTGWKYYTAQVDGEVIEDISQMVGADNKWWTTEREHLTHCAYLFIRMSHALSTRSRADHLIMNHGHAKHCALYLLNKTMESSTIDKVYTRGGGYFGSC